MQNKKTIDQKPSKNAPRVLYREELDAKDIRQRAALLVAPIAAVRAVAELNSRKPQLWTPRRLSSFFNLSMPQVLRYIQVGAVERTRLQRFVFESMETKRILAEGDVKAFMRFVRRRTLPLDVRPMRIQLKGAREKDFTTGIFDEDNGQEPHGADTNGPVSADKEGLAEPPASALAEEGSSPERFAEEDLSEIEQLTGSGDMDYGEALDPAAQQKKKPQYAGIANRRTELVAAENLLNHLNDDLHVFVSKKLGVQQEQLLPTRLYVLEAFSVHEGRFSLQHQQRLFGVNDPEEVANNIGPRAPQLLRREIPTAGPGSGKTVPGALASNRLRAPMLIVDATRASRVPAGRLWTPIYVREASGSLRYANFVEHSAAMKSESNRWGKKKFSPH